jgi:hypothetical protein
VAFGSASVACTVATMVFSSLGEAVEFGSGLLPCSMNKASCLANQVAARVCLNALHTGLILY